MQYGALPVRLRDGNPVVMLVTSRDTGRWVIPKGWPMPGLSREQAAATEAFEEAGLRGRVIGPCLGGYSYWKQFRRQRMLCTVDVFLFRVDVELARWPEKRQRLRHWFDPQEAATLVEEQVLADLIREVPVTFAAATSKRRGAAPGPEATDVQAPTGRRKNKAAPGKKKAKASPGKEKTKAPPDKEKTKAPPGKEKAKAPPGKKKTKAPPETPKTKPDEPGAKTAGAAPDRKKKKAAGGRKKAGRRPPDASKPASGRRKSAKMGDKPRR